MMTPNSVHCVVAADDVAARKALSELGAAPLPPVAELEAAYALAVGMRLSAVRARDLPKCLYWRNESNRLRDALETARRATGGNDKSSDPREGGRA